MPETAINDQEATEIGREVIQFYRSLMKNEMTEMYVRIEAARRLEGLVFDDFAEEAE
jgi:hypothetical protein